MITYSILVRECSVIYYHNSVKPTCTCIVDLRAYCATPVAPTFTTPNRNEPPVKAKNTQLTDDIARSELYPQTPS